MKIFYPLWRVRLPVVPDPADLELNFFEEIPTRSVEGEHSRPALPGTTPDRVRMLDQIMILNR